MSQSSIVTKEQSQDWDLGVCDHKFCAIISTIFRKGEKHKQLVYDSRVLDLTGAVFPKEIIRVRAGK